MIGWTSHPGVAWGCAGCAGRLRWAMTRESAIPSRGDCGATVGGGAPRGGRATRRWGLRGVTAMGQTPCISVKTVPGGALARTPSIGEPRSALLPPHDLSARERHRPVSDDAAPCHPLQPDGIEIADGVREEPRAVVQCTRMCAGRSAWRFGSPAQWCARMRSGGGGIAAARERDRQPLATDLAFSSSAVPSAITCPWSITAIRSARRSASSRYCVVSSSGRALARPVRGSRPTSRGGCAGRGRSSARRGTAPAARTRAAARSRRRRMPPE